jgi:hypothetical protein
MSNVAGLGFALAMEGSAKRFEQKHREILVADAESRCSCSGRSLSSPS